MYTVQQVMKTSKITTLKDWDTLQTAIEKLDDFNISAMPVMDGLGRTVGVLSKTDIARRKLLRFLADGKTPGQIYVKDLMNRTPPVTIRPEATVQEAIKLLHRRGVHRLFVVNATNHYVGVISATDIIRMLVTQTV